MKLVEYLGLVKFAKEAAKRYTVRVVICCLSKRWQHSPMACSEMLFNSCKHEFNLTQILLISPDGEII